MRPITFGEIDPDGALGEAVEGLGVTRATVLRGAGVGGLALFGGLAAAPGAGAARGGDLDILNFLLTLEYVQAAFYTDAEHMGKLRGKPERAARLIGATERAHVDAYRKRLGRKAIKRPRFNFRGTTERMEPFARTGIALEDLSVAAYKAAALQLESRGLLASALSIHSVEARHAAWMRRAFGVVPVKDAFDRTERQRTVERTLASTGFVTREPTMVKKREPRFTG